MCPPRMIGIRAGLNRKFSRPDNHSLIKQPRLIHNSTVRVSSSQKPATKTINKERFVSNSFASNSSSNEIPMRQMKIGRLVNDNGSNPSTLKNNAQPNAATRRAEAERLLRRIPKGGLSKKTVSYSAPTRQLPKTTTTAQNVFGFVSSISSGFNQPDAIESEPEVLNSVKILYKLDIFTVNNTKTMTL